MCYGIALLISAVVWLYILVVSFKDGCLWPAVILFFGPIAILIYVLTTYKGNKVAILGGFYAPLIVSAIAKFVFGFA